MGYSGAGGKLIREKTRGKTSRDNVPLNVKVILLEKMVDVAK